VRQDGAGGAPPTSGLDNTSPILPVLMISTGGKTIAWGDKIPASMKVIEDHAGTHRDLASRPASLETPIGIDVHGATSVRLPKQSYGLELRDAAGMDRRFAWLGFPSESDFILHSGGQDKTILRNALAYALGRETGRWAPRTRFVELFIDNVYKGVYVVVEKIKQDKSRVNIPRPAPDGAGDLTGGYIFKMDLAQGKPTDAILKDWVTPLPMVYTYVFPRFDEITAAQKKFLQDHVAKFEAMTATADFADPRRGYRAWLDIQSLVDFALFQELSNNIDAYQKSLYMQKLPKASGDKIAFGPLWDFDFAFGVAPFRDGQKTDIWAWQMNRFGTEPVAYNPPKTVPHVPAYWEKLWKDPPFLRDAGCRWKELRKQVFTTANVNAKVDAWWKQLELARPREMAANKYMAATELPYLKTWVDKRLVWMDGQLVKNCP
jgi:hypothetical protein